jgi:hypothetical protein
VSYLNWFAERDWEKPRTTSRYPEPQPRFEPSTPYIQVYIVAVVWFPRVFSTEWPGVLLPSSTYVIALSCGCMCNWYAYVACSCSSAMAPTVYVSDLVSNPSRSHLYPDTLDNFLGESVLSSARTFPSILKLDQALS